MQRQRCRGKTPGAADRAAAGQWRCAPVGGNGKTISIDRDIARPIFPGGHTLHANSLRCFDFSGKKRFRPQPGSAFCNRTVRTIIPYQELLGNYNFSRDLSLRFKIIPYQELLGNYNNATGWPLYDPHYTIPRTVRELQQYMDQLSDSKYYTIPRTVRNYN